MLYLARNGRNRTLKISLVARDPDPGSFATLTMSSRIDSPSITRTLPSRCARSSAGESNGFLIQDRDFALVFTGLRTVADARCSPHWHSRRVAQTCEVLQPKILRS